jgi:hypothetical protein
MPVRDLMAGVRTKAQLLVNQRGWMFDVGRSSFNMFFLRLLRLFAANSFFLL